MDYDEAIRWLLTLPDFERTGEFAGRTDVEPMRALLAELGDPHRGRPTIHVAGSKGKGSTGVMAEAILRADGRRTSYYISPHLHRYNERIRIDASPIDREAFASAMTAVHDAMPAVEPRFEGRTFIAFDALTAAAFVAFRDAGVDAQVVEVGLGGTLDSTNVFGGTAGGDPHVIVITPVSLEHTEILGSTIPEIASQKAGIIIEGSVVVAGPQRESALDVFHAVADERGATMIEVAKVCQMARSSARGAATAEGQKFRLKTPRATYEATLPLIGQHQLENAATAVVACEELAARAGFELTPQHIASGLAAVTWPGRLEVLRRKPLVVIDGAHNGDSTKRMAQALREYLGITRAAVLFGTLSGKDVTSMAAVVAPIADAVFAASWPSARAADPRELAEAFRRLDVPATAYANLPQAFEAATAHAGERGNVVAFGSLAFVAAVREYLLGIESDMIRLASIARKQPPDATQGEPPDGP